MEQKLEEKNRRGFFNLITDEKTVTHIIESAKVSGIVREVAQRYVRHIQGRTPDEVQEILTRAQSYMVGHKKLSREELEDVDVRTRQRMMLYEVITMLAGAGLMAGGSAALTKHGGLQGGDITGDLYFAIVFVGFMLFIGGMLALWENRVTWYDRSNYAPDCVRNSVRESVQAKHNENSVEAFFKSQFNVASTPINSQSQADNLTQPLLTSAPVPGLQD